MYKALNYWVFGGFDGQKTPQEFIDFAAEHGLDGIELSCPDVVSENATEAECKAIAAYAAQKNIRIRTLASGYTWGTQLGAIDQAERATAVAFTKKHLQVAAWLGCEAILVIPGASNIPWNADLAPKSYPQVWDNCLASMKELAPVAESLKVKIGLENVWGRFLLSPMEWKLFLDAVGSAYVGCYFDIGNCCLYARPQDYVEALGAKYIAAIHIKNFAGTDCGGGLTGFGDDLMVGDVDYPALVDALKKANYQGPITVEMIPFCRGDKLVLPDNDLAIKMTEQLKQLEKDFFN